MFFACALIQGQTFDLEQTMQLMRPRLKTESEFVFDAKFKDTTSLYNGFENSAHLTFPIRRRFKTEIDLNLKSLKIRDIIKNSIRIKASEILGSVRVSHKQLRLGFDSLPVKNVYNVSTSVSGLHLTKRYRILFYSGGVSLHEQDKTMNAFGIRASALIGQYHIRGLRKSFFYGIATVYSDGLLIPTPFIGGTEPIGKHVTFNYAIPAFMNVQYHNKRSFAIIGVKADGYRAGIQFKGNRTNMNFMQGGAYVSYRHKFSNTFQLQMEGGYNFYQNIQFDEGLVKNDKYPLKGSFYANIGIQVFMGKSILEKIIEQLF